jgi:hypothetical protein
VRSRLRDVIVAMGYDVAPEEEEAEYNRSEEVRKQVLDDLAAGRITSEDAIARLRGEG